MLLIRRECHRIEPPAASRCGMAAGTPGQRARLGRRTGAPGMRANRGGSCRRPACSQCSNVCSECSLAWLCNECITMEEHNCHHLAIQEWAERNRQDREQLRAASARVQQMISV
eukprot:8525778-Pyramimonas_sp.AAC.1